MRFDGCEVRQGADFCLFCLIIGAFKAEVSLFFDIFGVCFGVMLLKKLDLIGFVWQKSIF
jgi:hypothetical protein